MTIQRRALISVSNKYKILEFTTNLIELGWEIISTGGTAKLLSENGLEITPIEQVTGFPELLDGRVKTLHPAVHGGILFRRDDEKHHLDITRTRIRPIDLVCVNLYPFEETLSSGETDESKLIEKIDIGGPTMIRASAKNYQDVTVITNPDQYDETIQVMKQNKGNTTTFYRQKLAQAAFQKTFEYEKAIASWINKTVSKEKDNPPHKKNIALRYGENPHQQGRLELHNKSTIPSVAHANVFGSEPLSYNNLLDSDAALQCCLDIYSLEKSPSAVVVKHLNPCGASIGLTSSQALEKALAGDPLAAFGGIVACSHAINEEEASLLISNGNFLEVISAPSFSAAAKEILANKWKRVRLLEYGPISTKFSSKEQIRSITDAHLVQEQDMSIPNPNEWTHKAGPAPSPETLRSASFAFICAKHLKSNAIAIVNETRMIGAGMGQVDRLSACSIAIERARKKLEKCSHPIAASDAFFPFSDGPKILIENGVKTIVQPGGSKRDEDTINLCEASRTTLLLTGIRTFRH